MLATKAIALAVLVVATWSDSVPEQTTSDLHIGSSTEEVLACSESTSVPPEGGDARDPEDDGVETGWLGDNCTDSGGNGTNCSTESPPQGGGPGGGPPLFTTGTVTRETYNMVEWVASCVIMALSLVGLVLNVFTVVVYIHPDMRSASSTYLAALSTAETLYLSFVIVCTIPSFIFGSEAIYNYTFLFAGLYLTNFVLVTLRRMAFVLTFVVSFDRFIAVTFPFKYKEMRLSGHPARISIIVTIVIALMHINQILKYEIIPLGDGRYTFRLTQYVADQLTVFNKYSDVTRIILVYIPLLGTLFLNFLTMVSLRRHRLKSRGLKTTKNCRDKTETRTTVAITVSTLLFVSLSLPTNVQTLFQSYHPTYGWMKQDHYLFLVINRIFGVLEILSNVFDFLAYFVLSQKFRATFQRILCCGRDPGPKSGETKTAPSTSNTTQVSQLSRENPGNGP